MTTSHGDREHFGAMPTDDARLRTTCNVSTVKIRPMPTLTQLERHTATPTLRLPAAVQRSHQKRKVDANARHRQRKRPATLDIFDVRYEGRVIRHLVRATEPTDIASRRSRKLLRRIRRMEPSTVPNTHAHHQVTTTSGDDLRRPAARHRSGTHSDIPTPVEQVVSNVFVHRHREHTSSSDQDFATRTAHIVRIAWHLERGSCRQWSRTN